MMLMHYRTPIVCRVSKTLGKIHKTLGKWFAECNTRRTALAKNSDGKVNFAECFLFAECPTLGKVETEKNPKKMGFLPKKNGIFFSMEAPTGQRPPIYGIFRVNFMATRPTQFETETSRCARTSSTTTPHSHLCLDSVLVPNILY